MKQQAFATRNITEAIVAFAQFLRSHGLQAGIEETRSALLAADAGIIPHPRLFKYALKSIFCSSPEENAAFDRLFPLFWETNPMDLQMEKNQMHIHGVVQERQKASLVMLGQGRTEETGDEGRIVSGANESERLRKTDFSKVAGIEARALEDIAEKLFRELALRLRRRMKESRRRGEINIRRTIRRSIGSGGEPMVLYRRKRKQRKQRLIVFLDVSGSMDQYSFFLLRFVCALKERFRQLEAFVFSTSLVRISKALRQDYLEEVLFAISRQADNWSSGTKIGECLRDFVDKFGKRILNGSPVILILSDGLDTGDPAVLNEVMGKLKERSRKIVWLNPLKGMKNYEPLAKGMQAALPRIDHFQSAHNLESLMALEKILIND